MPITRAIQPVGGHSGAMLRRRPLIRSALCLAAVGSSACVRRRDGENPTTTPQPGLPSRELESTVAADDHALLDAQLDAMHGFDPEFSEGLSNHGPMACEALAMLGGTTELAAFAEDYRRRLEPMSAAESIDATRWLEALGRPQARAGLIAMFARRLQDEDPRAVLSEVVPQLAPGISGAAFHGCLRLAHAYRAWTAHPSAVRRTELAHGLGYWAARYQEMPGEPGSVARTGVDAAALLSSIPVLLKEERREGLIFERFGALQGHTGFADALAQFDPSTVEPAATLDAAAAASARLYLSTTDPRARFVYLHGVTGSAATRLLLPTVAPAQQHALAVHLVHAVAGVHATHGGAGASLAAWDKVTEVDRPGVVASARASKDDHTIKLVEAALREFDRSGSPELLAVAAHRTSA